MALLKDLRDYVGQTKQVKKIAPESYQQSRLPNAFSRWRRFLDTNRNPLDDEQPWINFAAAAFLETTLRPDMRVFEWGSGGSTLFYGKRVQQVVAIEHDPSWAGSVRERVQAKSLTHCDVRLITPENTSTATADPADAQSYISSVKEYRGMSFETYVRSIDEFPDGFFSVVVVDGRARPSCARHALTKVSTGGFLLLDNAEREQYQRIEASLPPERWKLHDFYGPGPYNRYFWRTRIWQKRA